MMSQRVVAVPEGWTVPVPSIAAAPSREVTLAKNRLSAALPSASLITSSIRNPVRG